MATSEAQLRLTGSGSRRRLLRSGLSGRCSLGSRLGLLRHEQPFFFFVIVIKHDHFVLLFFFLVRGSCGFLLTAFGRCFSRCFLRRSSGLPCSTRRSSSTTSASGSATSTSGGSRARGGSAIAVVVFAIQVHCVLTKIVPDNGGRVVVPRTVHVGVPVIRPRLAVRTFSIRAIAVLEALIEFVLQLLHHLCHCILVVHVAVVLDQVLDLVAHGLYDELFHGVFIVLLYELLHGVAEEALRENSEGLCGEEVIHKFVDLDGVHVLSHGGGIG